MYGFIRTVETIELVKVLGPGDARDSWGGANGVRLESEVGQ
jgi:hypothetical protein